MREVTISRYYLPNKNPRGKPYASGWAMTAEEAEKRGALGIVPGTSKVIQESESETLEEAAARWPQTPSGSES
jgi:hypothetical protein